MASIISISGKWRAQVRRKGVKAITKTFATKREAQQWARKTEHQIDTGESLPQQAVTLAHVVEQYRALRVESGREVLDTSSEHYQLTCLSDLLGEKVIHKLGVDDIVEFATKRKNEGAGPYTVNMDISKLGTVLRYTAHRVGFNLPDVVGAARPVLHYMRLIGGGGKRQRRPTGDELARLFEYFEERKDRGHVWCRMKDIVTLAMVVGLRRGEIFRIEWADLDAERKMVLVRDRKDPRKKKGNHQWVPLLGRAWSVVQAQPRGDRRIFPVHAQTVTKYFTQACGALSIPDLHLHDMRREAVSALLEAGWTDREVRLVTGHASGAFEVYAKPDPAKLHEKPMPSPKV